MDALLISYNHSLNMLPEIYSTLSKYSSNDAITCIEYTPKLIRNLRKKLKHTDDFRRVNENYLYINGKWVYSDNTTKKEPRKILLFFSIFLITHHYRVTIGFISYFHIDTIRCWV